MTLSEPCSHFRIWQFSDPAIRTFHLSWIAFFVCFFGWFGMAPLLPVIRNDLSLSPGQISLSIVASVLFTIAARAYFGRLCDRIGPRKSYTLLLTLGSIPVLGSGFCNNFGSFILCRFLIGAIGASFVITQFHTSRLFKKDRTGTANAFSAGWGNLGAAATQLGMPLCLGLFLSWGISQYHGWRIAVSLPGILMLLMGGGLFFLGR